MCDECDWESEIERCNSLMDMCNEVPERGEEYASSVHEKAGSISATIEDNQHVTEKQMEAIDNMMAGVQRCIDRGD